MAGTAGDMERVLDEWRRHGFAEDEAQAWSREGFGPNDAALWREVYRDPGEARKRRNDGYLSPFDP
jgi:hypothetical protein